MGFGVWGWGLGVWGLGFRGEGFGLRALGLGEGVGGSLGPFRAFGVSGPVEALIYLKVRETFYFSLCRARA